MSVRVYVWLCVWDACMFNIFRQSVGQHAVVYGWLQLVDGWISGLDVFCLLEPHLD